MSAPTPSRTDRHVALVGLSGAGKSTVAPMLAARLGVGPAVDLDREVEARAGRAVHEVFAEDGENVFRRFESELLGEILASPPCVIATGGGVVLDPGNRQALRAAAWTVWLRASPGHLAERLADSAEARPMLAGDTRFALDRLDQERQALYAEVSDVVVDVDGVAAAEVAEEVEQRLRDRGLLGER